MVSRQERQYKVQTIYTYPSAVIILCVVRVIRLVFVCVLLFLSRFIINFDCVFAFSNTNNMHIMFLKHRDFCSQYVVRTSCHEASWNRTDSYLSVHGEIHCNVLELKHVRDVTCIRLSFRTVLFVIKQSDWSSKCDRPLEDGDVDSIFSI